MIGVKHVLGLSREAAISISRAPDPDHAVARRQEKRVADVRAGVNIILPIASAWAKGLGREPDLRATGPILSGASVPGTR
jgi:hypothetical protein